MSAALSGGNITVTVDSTPATVDPAYEMPPPFNLTVPRCNAFVQYNGSCATDAFGNTVTPNAGGSITYQADAAGYGSYIKASQLPAGKHVINVYVSPLLTLCNTTGELQLNATYIFTA